MIPVLTAFCETSHSGSHFVTVVTFDGFGLFQHLEDIDQSAVVDLKDIVGEESTVRMDEFTVVSRQQTTTHSEVADSSTERTFKFLRGMIVRYFFVILDSKFKGKINEVVL